MGRSDEDETHCFGEVQVIAETDKALGVLRDDNGDTEEKPFWVPKSVIHESSEAQKDGDEGELVTKLWWAEKGGHV